MPAKYKRSAIPQETFLQIRSGIIYTKDLVVLLTQKYHFFKYSPFHKTLPKSGSKIHWISVRFYEMGDSKDSDPPEKGPFFTHEYYFRNYGQRECKHGNDQRAYTGWQENI